MKEQRDRSSEVATAVGGGPRKITELTRGKRAGYGRVKPQGTYADAVPVARAPSVFEKRFGLLAVGIICLWIATQVFEFSLTPPSYKGLFLTTPFYGLHAWNNTVWAWGARSHVKYGLGYTRGYSTLVCGDSPPAHPQRYVSHPQLYAWLLAGWMWFFGTADISVRLFDLTTSVLALGPILLLLRNFCGSCCALLSGLILVMFPYSGFFGFDPLMVLLALWALWRYSLLVGRLGEGAITKKRYFAELAIALFLMIQLNWTGVFYAFTLGMHFVVHCVLQRRIQWKVLTALAFGSLLSLGLTFSIMLSGLRNNLAVEAAEKPSLEITHDVKGITWRQTMEFGSSGENTAWGLLNTLYQWRSREGERRSFEWRPWIANNVEFASTNFTPAVLVLVGGYLIYLLVVPLINLCRRLLAAAGAVGPIGHAGVSHPFGYLWFFLPPGVLFILTFKGLMWKHQYWQSAFAPFMAIGAALSILAIGDLLRAVHRLIGGSVVAVLIVMLVVFCNEGLAQYRAIRWHSPVTIELFKRLNEEIPPDKALLTFKDFLVVQSTAKAPSLRPEFAWYLDRDMVMANAWQYDLQWARATRIEEATDKTINEIRAQAATGRFQRYLIPDCEPLGVDPTYAQAGNLGTADVGPATGSGPIQLDPFRRQSSQEQNWLTSLSLTELDRRFKNGDRENDRLVFWEKHRRYRESLIARLKELYAWRYCENRAKPRDEDFCYEGITPAYLFDLTRPVTGQTRAGSDTIVKSVEPIKSVK